MDRGSIPRISTPLWVLSSAVRRELERVSGEHPQGRHVRLVKIHHRSRDLVAHILKGWWAMPVASASETKNLSGLRV